MLTLGKGILYFAQYAPGTETPRGERDLGNAPEFNLTIEEEKLDHYSSRGGVRQKDDSISLETTRSGTITVDNIDAKNLALFFFGSAEILARSAATGATETFAAVEADLWYQLGTSPANPAGQRQVTNVVVTGVPSTPIYDLGTDYELDAVRGRIRILTGSDIVTAGTFKVTYDVAAHNVSRIVTGDNAIQGALRFIAHNPKGADIDYFMPKVSISPNGDFGLISDEWMTIPFNLEVLKKTGLEAIYMNGQPYSPT